MISFIKKYELIFQRTITVILLIDYICTPFIVTPPIFNSLRPLLEISGFYFFFAFMWFYLLSEKKKALNNKESFAFKLATLFMNEKQKKGMMDRNKAVIYYIFFFLSFIFLFLFMAVIYNLIWLKLFSLK